MNPIVERRCSFCHQTGHNVNMCNATRLHEFRKICLANRIVCDYNEGESKGRFKIWLVNYSVSQPTLVSALGSRFFRIPLHVDFIERAEQITDFIYGMYYYEINEIINSVNDTMFRLAITNMNVLSGLLIEERIQYITEITDFLERQKTTTNKKFQFATLLKEIKSEQIEETFECSICYNEKMEKDFVHLNCNHQFCGECLISTLKTTQSEARCSLCRQTITQISLYDTVVEKEISKYIV
jgi:hypothetical protein